jgi:hypothetical protein
MWRQYCKLVKIEKVQFHVMIQKEVVRHALTIARESFIIRTLSFAFPPSESHPCSANLPELNSI